MILLYIDPGASSLFFQAILSGDHGYRGDKRINSNQTFMAFYGFEEKDLTNIHSVQDLGSLINACY